MKTAGVQTAAVIILLAMLPQSLGAARPVELADYYRIETAATPAISPDGRWVVFVRNTTIEAENRRHSELWIVPADGSAAATRLRMVRYPGDYHGGWPAWDMAHRYYQDAQWFREFLN